MFYNTGIGTYVWIVTNRKEKRRKGKILRSSKVHGGGKRRRHARSRLDTHFVAAKTWSAKGREKGLRGLGAVDSIRQHRDGAR
jgi:transposase